MTKYRKKNFVVIFLARLLSIPKNIDNIIKNDWLKFQRPVSNTLVLYRYLLYTIFDIIQKY